MNKLKEHKTILVGLLLCLSLIGEALVIILGSAHRDISGTVNIGKVEIPFNSLQGTIQTFTLMCCIMMACVDCYFGAAVSAILVSLMATMTSFKIIMSRNLAPVPGVLNGLLALVVVLLIGYLLRRAKKKSITDYATGLLNSVGFHEVLNKRIREKKSGSLVYYQINNFRAINDDYGHDIGDQVLRVAASRMKKVVSEHGNIGRIGGSEFAILLKNDVNALEVVKNIFEELNVKIQIQNDGIHLDCYIESNAGIAHFPEDAKDSVNLFKCADVALMQSMDEGSNKIAVFDEKMSSKMHEEKKMEQMIKKAYDENYFFLEYQPQFSVNDKKLRGFESLIRMNSPEGGRISPGQFIPVAEKSNLIFSIDEYVLNFVTKEFASLVKNASYELTISVNISANGISRPEFVSIVKKCLDDNGFPPKNLEIEITEYSFEDSQDQTVKNIKELKNLGVKVALDDFGTGYASLARLMNLSVDLLKVDKSLVDDIEKGKVNRDFINSIGSMGHLLNCKVVLEGVETVNQLEYIKDLNCDYVQGFVWGKPMSYEDAKSLI
ncbi:MAG: bifunctional diguanylate cyclase/phosphodiesterase [Lachnospiraceae bacterium]|nr:bifunctional diguanylate cyclase/phosphodiesterase [Lachnospiraceae bacterium]